MSKRPIIDGATRVLDIVGHPITQVRAPEVWTGLFQSCGINMICVPFHVLPEHLASFFAGLRGMKNLAGTIVTIPHKPASVELVDSLTERAEMVRSVNFITTDGDGKWRGDITEGIGFVENLKTNGRIQAASGPCWLKPAA